MDLLPRTLTAALVAFLLLALAATSADAVDSGDRVTPHGVTLR